MADRTLTAAMLAQINAVDNRPGNLFDVIFDDESVYVTDFFTSVTWNGNTYVANGTLLGYEGVTENVEMQATQARITLSGIDLAWVARVLTKNYLNRRIVIRKATLNASWQVIVDPAIAFDGLMKKPQIVTHPDSGQCSLVITASHDASDVNNQSGRRTNHESQQLHFAGDGLFKYSAQADREISWGRA